jgi:hypothetical protein
MVPPERANRKRSSSTGGDTPTATVGLTGGKEMRAQAGVFLAGVGLGLAIAWMVEALLVGRGVVSIYLGPVAVLAVFASLLVRNINLDKASLRNLVLWVVVVVALLALFTLLQPGFR